MIEYNWYRIFNLEEFTALNLTSISYTLELQDIGEAEILVTKGNLVSIVYDETFLPIQFNDNNPFEFEGRAVFLNVLTKNVYLGIAVEE